LNNKKSKTIIIGASGYIGSGLLIKASVHGLACGTSSAGRDGLIAMSLDSPFDFDYEIICPEDTIILTAAISAPDVCAREFHKAWAINVIGTSEFISQVMARGGRVIFFSSDTVYGERSKIFDETAETDPSGDYALMKAEVELKFLQNPLFKSIRLSYVFSRNDKLTKYLESCSKCQEEAVLFHPFYRSIIYREDVVEGALALARCWSEFPQNVINFGGPEVLSRVDFAQCLKQTVIPNLQFRVMEPEDEFFKNRPRSISMLSEILPRLLGRPPRTLAEAALFEFC